MVYGHKFDVEKTTQEIIKWIQKWFLKNGNNCNAVIGISGGKDSSVVAALCVEALGKDRVIGVLMPQNTQNDIDYSYALVEHLGIRNIEINIGLPIKEILYELEHSPMFVGENENVGCVEASQQTKVNLPARIRMSTLYAVAQSCNGRVSCNTNLSERFLGYGTRWADTIGDFAPIAYLTSDEVVAVGKYLGLPTELTNKVPSDGLCGKTDEDNFGFTYEVLNKYITTREIDDEEIKQKIDAMNKKNRFKLEMMPCFPDSI